MERMLSLSWSVKAITIYVRRMWRPCLHLQSTTQYVAQALSYCGHLTPMPFYELIQAVLSHTKNNRTRMAQVIWRSLTTPYLYTGARKGIRSLECKNTVLYFQLIIIKLWSVFQFFCYSHKSMTFFSYHGTFFKW